MLFSNRNIHDIDLKISDTSIERKHTERFLGVMIDDQLTFKQHLNIAQRWNYIQS